MAVETLYVSVWLCLLISVSKRIFFWSMFGVVSSLWSNSGPVLSTTPESNVIFLFLHPPLHIKNIFHFAACPASFLLFKWAFKIPRPYKKCWLSWHVQSLEYQQLCLFKYTFKIPTVVLHVSVCLFLSISTLKVWARDPMSGVGSSLWIYNQNCDNADQCLVQNHQSLLYRCYYLLGYIFKLYRQKSMFWSAHLCPSRNPKYQSGDICLASSLLSVSNS